MALIVELEIKSKSTGKTVKTKALVNSGFKVKVPEIIITQKIAEDLELYPNLPKEAEIQKYKVAGGAEFEFATIPKEIECKLILEDRETNYTECDCTIMPEEDIAIISDKLASALEIVILDVGEGKWCLKDEIGKITRDSAKING